MQRLTLTLTAKEPLVITQGSAEGMDHTSLAYIPGNMLLGAFANLWRQANRGLVPDECAGFRTLFLTGAVQWGHAYPVINNTPCVPMPLCLQAFKGKSKLDTVGGCALNMLLCPEDNPDWVRNEFNKLFAEEEFTKLTRHGGTFLHPEACLQPEITRQWNMHVALHEGQRAAQQGQLFGFDTIAPETQFSSTILCQNAKEAEDIAGLVVAGTEIRIGHARSAGYGCVVVQTGKVEPSPPQQAPVGAGEEAGCFTLFLLSDYAPRFGWQTPYESLQAELKELLGPCNLEGPCFMEHEHIAGFNGLWKMPKATRTMLRKGSVIVVRLPKDASKTQPLTLPPSLGGAKVEGYGRILLNPAFLAKEALRAKEVAPQATVAAQVLALDSKDPMLLVLRQRSLTLQAGREALRQLHEFTMQRFVTDAAQLSKPSQSQRGNVRQLVTMKPQPKWKQEFTAALAKETVKKHWQGAATHPKNGRKEHVGDIMQDLLDDKQFVPKPLELPGGSVTDAENRTYAALAHKQFLLGLLTQWEKESRTKTNKGGHS